MKCRTTSRRAPTYTSGDIAIFAARLYLPKIPDRPTLPIKRRAIPIRCSFLPPSECRRYERFFLRIFRILGRFLVALLYFRVQQRLGVLVAGRNSGLKLGD